MLPLLLLISCEKETGPVTPPQISLAKGDYISTDTTVAAAKEMRFRVDLHATANDITLFYIEVTTDSTAIWFDTGMHTRQVTWERSFIKGFSEQETWKFRARDRQGLEAFTTLVISLDTSAAFTTLDVYDDVRMGAQGNTETGGILDIGSGNAWFFDEVADNASLQATVDMIFYFGEDGHTLASPGANVGSGIFPGSFSDWQVINTTRYIPAGLTEAEFGGITTDSLLVARYNEGEAKRKAKDVAPGDTYLFRNQAGKLGVFFVNQVNGTEEGYVEIDIRIQP